MACWSVSQTEHQGIVPVPAPEGDARLVLVIRLDQLHRLIRGERVLSTAISPVAVCCILQRGAIPVFRLIGEEPIQKHRAAGMGFDVADKWFDRSRNALGHQIDRQRGTLPRRAAEGLQLVMDGGGVGEDCGNLAGRLQVRVRLLPTGIVEIQTGGCNCRRFERWPARWCSSLPAATCRCRKTDCESTSTCSGSIFKSGGNRNIFEPKSTNSLLLVSVRNNFRLGNPVAKPVDPATQAGNIE